MGRFVDVVELNWECHVRCCLELGIALSCGISARVAVGYFHVALVDVVRSLNVARLVLIDAGLEFTFETFVI